MKQVKFWSTSLLVAMMFAIIVVTLGIALVLFPIEERTAVFYLSLVMILVAEAATFAWPITNSLNTTDTRSPSFVFGLGLQSVFVIYLVGVLFLGILGHYGATEYGLISKFMFGSDIKLIGASATGNGMFSGSTYDGLRNSQLIAHRSIDAGAQDDYIIKAVATVPPAISTTQADCILDTSESGTGFMMSLTTSVKDNLITVNDCVPATAGIPGFVRASIQPRLRQLAVDLTVDGGPRQIAGTQGSYEVIYRVSIRNLSSLGSLKTLGILHSILALLLLLTLLTWRMGSRFVNEIDEQRRVTTQSFDKFRFSLREFYDTTVIDDQPGLKDFIVRLSQLNEETRYCSSETPAGLESYDSGLANTLVALQNSYGDYVNGAGDLKMAATDLQTKLAKMAALLKQRDDACRHAR